MSSGMAESLAHKDDSIRKAVLGASFTATLSDLFLCGSFTNVSHLIVAMYISKFVERKLLASSTFYNEVRPRIEGARFL